MSGPTIAQRKRSKLACQPCRERKRKCDGSRPCETCIKSDYECSYGPSKRKRYLPSSAQNLALTFTSPSPQANLPFVREDMSQVTNVQQQLSSLDANSGAAFVRGLALSLDPTNAPRMHLFAWNVFMGARQADHITAREDPIAYLLSEFDMETLALVYFERVDPCYGFVDRQDVGRRIKRCWSSAHAEAPNDAVLCGIAALGCLFSRCQSKVVELSLLEAARVELERTMSAMPDFSTITAWILRVAYLRMTSSPHAAWLASCIAMHMIEAAGLHCEPIAESMLQPPTSGVNPELRRRMCGVAQHLNLWISFDLGRSRVLHRNATTIAPSEKPGDFTTELLSLLPYSEILDPSKAASSDELTSTLARVLERTHSEPPSTLAQCNLVLCLYRRLRAANTAPRGRVLDHILDLTARAVRSAQLMLTACSPWHHIAQIPFQLICTLLAIDTPASLAQLEDAMQTLENVATTYSTETLQEAVRTASLIILLHQRRKEADFTNLMNVLRRHPFVALSPGHEQDAVIVNPQKDHQSSTSNSLWFDDTIADISFLQNFDIDQFMCEGSS